MNLPALRPIHVRHLGWSAPTVCMACADLRTVSYASLVGTARIFEALESGKRTDCDLSPESFLVQREKVGKLKSGESNRCTISCTTVAMTCSPTNSTKY